jgi:hypothetical protein
MVRAIVGVPSAKFLLGPASGVDELDVLRGEGTSDTGESPTFSSEDVRFSMPLLAAAKLMFPSQSGLAWLHDYRVNGIDRRSSELRH